VASELQSDAVTSRLVKLLGHVDMRVVVSTARLLSDLSCTGGDEDIDSALSRLQDAGCAAAARAACVRTAIVSNEAGLHLCDLLCALCSHDKQACAATLADEALLRCVVDTLLLCDSVMWFEDSAPAVQLVATLVHFGDKASARSFIESRDFALLSALAGSLTCDDRGEGVVGGWLMCVDAVLKKGIDGNADGTAEEEEEEVGDDEDDDDKDDNDDDDYDDNGGGGGGGGGIGGGGGGGSGGGGGVNDSVPIESAYVGACTRLGVRAVLEGVEVFRQGGRRLLRKYFVGG
jgi:uncharacterized membrane protein YgcG